MTRDELIRRATKVVQDQWAHYRPKDMVCREITPATDFAEDLDFDSLDLVELTMAFEEEFDLEVPDPEADEIKTFAQAVEYLTGKLAVAA